MQVPINHEKRVEEDFAAKRDIQTNKKFSGTSYDMIDLIEEIKENTIRDRPRNKPVEKISAEALIDPSAANNSILKALLEQVKGEKEKPKSS